MERSPSHSPDSDIEDIIVRDFLLELVSNGYIDESKDIVTEAMKIMILRPEVELDDVLDMRFGFFIKTARSPPVPEGYDNFAWGAAVLDR